MDILELSFAVHQMKFTFKCEMRGQWGAEKKMNQCNNKENKRMGQTNFTGSAVREISVEVIKNQKTRQASKLLRFSGYRTYKTYNVHFSYNLKKIRG